MIATNYTEIFENKANDVILLESILQPVIDEYESLQSLKKNKLGRPKSISTIKCLDIILCVLIIGLSWKRASKYVTCSTKYKSTVHRNYLRWINAGIIKNSHSAINSKYLELHESDVHELLIDSTDIMNEKMGRIHTYKSFKLNKQALRVTILSTCNKKPIDYTVEPAHKPDSELGYELLMTTNLGSTDKIYIGGDTGYRMNNTKISNLRKKGLIICYVKPRKSKKKRRYTTKNYKPKHKRVRHSNKMKKCLDKRHKIEHVNSVFHRSYKRLNRVSETLVCVYDAFIQLAICMMLLTDIM